MSEFDLAKSETWLPALQKMSATSTGREKMWCGQVYTFFKTPAGQQAITLSLSIALTLCANHTQSTFAYHRNPKLSRYQAEVPLASIMEPIWRAQEAHQWLVPEDNLRNSLIARRGLRLIRAALMHAGFKVQRTHRSGNNTRHKSDTLLIDWSDGLKGAKP